VNYPALPVAMNIGCLNWHETMSPNSGPSALPIAEVERLRRLDAIIDAARKEGSDDTETIEIVKAFLARQPQTSSNGFANKLMLSVIATLSAAGIVGGVIMSNRVSVLETQIEQCLKKP
jgi:hypothetical protein